MSLPPGNGRLLTDRQGYHQRYPSLRALDLRVQKALALGRFRPTLDVDAFNAFNTAVVLRRITDGTSVSFRNASGNRRAEAGAVRAADPV